MLHAAALPATHETPLLRGWLHLLACVVAVPAGIVLIGAADGAMARSSVAVYMAAVVSSFGTSAAYHLFPVRPSRRRVLQRLDHAMIYLLIAGTYVPATLLGLPLPWAIPLLSAVCGGAVLGMALNVAAFPRFPHWVRLALYPALGWAAVVAFPVLVDHVDTLTWLLLLAGGLAYTLGFPVLLLKRPDPWPEVFGYHEIWHVCTIIAAVLHFAAVFTLAR